MRVCARAMWMDGMGWDGMDDSFPSLLRRLTHLSRPLAPTCLVLHRHTLWAAQPSAR
jgi:hypothetical protein